MDLFCISRTIHVHMLLCTCDGEDTISHLCSQFSTDCIANCRRCLDYHKIRTLSGWQCSMQKKNRFIIHWVLFYVTLFYHRMSYLLVWSRSVQRQSPEKLPRRSLLPFCSWKFSFFGPPLLGYLINVFGKTDFTTDSKLLFLSIMSTRNSAHTTQTTGFIRGLC